MAANRTARRRLPALLVRLAHIEPVTGIGASTWERYDAAGLVPAPVRVGGCKLWGVAELRAWAVHGCPPRAEWQPLWQQLRRHAAGDRRR
jgi:hypothetical protein